ncbi:MAG: homoserine kinase [Brachymonas sp.]|nr:homoserine kinase [Brachymonas sp.]
MAVFTEVTLEDARPLFAQLAIGELLELRGIAGGIENTNYFATTSQGEYVLTLFERLSHAQLPFYLHLMRHLARHGLPVPLPQANAADEILFTLCGKPAAVVNKLRGASQLQPTPAHCAAVGEMLARMHLAGQDFVMQQPNLRGLAWWNETAPLVYPHISAQQRDLLQSELAYQNQIAASDAYRTPPRGAVHADLFRDNVMFEGDTLTGCFDFYFAGVDTWMFDLAVCLNDWAIHHADGSHEPERATALLDAYQSVRALTDAERALLPAMLRAGALRFWISRLWDFYLPRQASMLKPHDPAHFERVLRQRVAHAVALVA